MTLHERALAVTPGGAQTRSKRSNRFPFDPIYLTKGDGPYVWDTAGKRYIDFICGLGAISLGYGYPAIEAAVRRQLDRGVSFSLPTRLEVEVSEHVCDALGAEQVRFVKTGSEATEGAMRIARIATGRKVICSIGYHGWHTQHDSVNEVKPGVPLVLEEIVWGEKWGEKLNDDYFGDVAAILVEVCRDDPPPSWYVQHLKDTATKNGCLLIFDEMVTGFRWALKGAREYFGIEPDLACYGKGMANGYPLACIVGPREIMQHADHVSGTFGGECVSLAACTETLDVYQREPVVKTMWRTGEGLMAAFNKMAESSSLDLKMEGYAVHPRITGSRRDEFIKLAAAAGLIFHPAGFNIMYVHDEVMLEAIEGCAKAMSQL